MCLSSQACFRGRGGGDLKKKKPSAFVRKMLNSFWEPEIYANLFQDERGRGGACLSCSRISLLVPASLLPFGSVIFPSDLKQCCSADVSGRVGGGEAFSFDFSTTTTIAFLF